MAVGTALAIGGLVNAGMNLFGSYKASKAAKDAAKEQTKAADQALGVSRDVYNRQMYAMDPYANVGRQSMNVLGRLTSPGQPYTPRLQAYDAQTGYTAYGGGSPGPMTIGGTDGTMTRPRQGPPQGMGQPRMPFGGMQPMPYRPQGPPPQAAPMPYRGGGGIQPALMGYLPPSPYME